MAQVETQGRRHPHGIGRRLLQIGGPRQPWPVGRGKARSVLVVDVDIAAFQGQDEIVKGTVQEKFSPSTAGADP